MPLSRINAQSLTDASVVTAEIADGAITTAKLADNAVTTAKVNPTQTDITSVGTLTSFRSTGIDDNADALAMTIDSSERVLIGMTTASGSTDGIQFVKDGRIFSNVDGSAPLILNRKTSNGGIATFRKDGTDIGSIGVEGGDSLFLQSGTSNGSGLLYHGAGAKILPVRNSTSVDATIDLGQNNRRFKDLYLSSGVRVGGTGTANLLDDFEEGTFTPTVSNATGYSAQFGTYKKIGHLVFINANIVVTSASGSTNVISSLPFASKNTGNSSGNLSIGYYADVNTPMVWFSGYVLNASTNIYISGNSAGHTGATIQHNGANMFKSSGNSRIMFSVVYESA